ncbi:kinase-like domain-containing protein [Ilyonectria robusta]|uniref:kinase-like domain-containing protein n=1 Tax=Ilyonectria robusta TaxID=1079257 RepID=UPI001E8E619B|nr:kinase-like domain-containing protein [Ilyonectria robusta]KAH8736307.1 kinase-like domain-containing protein [Ilyonectria robusta]
MAPQMLFSLFPNNDNAQEILEANPDFQDTFSGTKCLSFSTEFKSKIPSRLVSFGRNSNHDVRLPSQPPGQRNYSSGQCYFFLAKSGELILRELAPSSIRISVFDATEDQKKKYSIQGTPPQRVIPKDRTARTILFLQTGAEFVFRWRIPLQDDKTDVDLVKRAADLAIPDMVLTSALPQALAPEHQYTLRSLFSAPAATKSGTQKSIHRYGELGQGTYGVVYKAVDLSSGEIWAVKEFKPKARTAQWTASFRREVEIMARLQHGNIVNLVHFQNFQLGQPCQLFFPLYKGNLTRLLPAHECIGPLPDVPTWAPRLRENILQALHYLHQNGVVHLDVKPDNILFDYADGNPEPTFLLTDFGLSVASSEFKGGRGGGTRFYMDPEVARGENASYVSDVWSFGITFGCVLGYWCRKDMLLTALDWNAKLQSLGSDTQYDESDSDPDYVRWYARVFSLVERGVLPDIFTRLFAASSHRATTVDCLNASYEQFFGRPQTLPQEARFNLEWHIPALSPNGMSFDIVRGGHGK